MKEEWNLLLETTSLKERGGGFLRIDEDRKYMARALELALRGLGHTRPNPIVGGVVARDGCIIGEGWHEQFGGPHAEVNAFAHCSEDPEGATLYVSLEPCAHYGKTPPCVDLVIAKKVARVVIAMEDPNPLVAGKSIRKLKEAGISVTVGVLEEKARKLNEVFLKYITARKPFVLYKAAMSLDGKTACYTGESQWISGEASREEVHMLRGCYAGIMVGAGTILADNPRLTARTKGFADPVRIIVDGKLSVPPVAKVFREEGRVIIITTSASGEGRRKDFEDMGAEIILADSEENGKVDLSAAMTGLYLKGIDGILLEGGAELAASAFEAGIVDKVRIYVSPMIIGGKEAPGLVGGQGAASIPEAVKLKNVSTEMSGEDLVVEAYVDHKACAAVPDKDPSNTADQNEVCPEGER